MLVAIHHAVLFGRAAGWLPDVVIAVTVAALAIALSLLLDKPLLRAAPWLLRLPAQPTLHKPRTVTPAV